MMPTESKITQRCTLELNQAKSNLMKYGKTFDPKLPPNCSQIDWSEYTANAESQLAACNIERCNQELQNLKENQYKFIFNILFYKIFIPLAIVIFEVILWIKLDIFPWVWK
jgi:hypothetical protein